MTYNLEDDYGKTEYIKSIFAENEIEISTEDAEKFLRYYTELVSWNKKLNLTAITDFVDVVKKHFLDSVLLLKLFNQFDFTGKRIIDVGTGAGFPGIPLAILLPDSHFTLLDSIDKKLEFVREIVKELELSNVSVIHERAEVLGRDEEHREKYDCLVSRAVASMNILLEISAPFVKEGGRIFLYKSRKMEEEAGESQRALEELNCEMISIKELENEGIIRKIAEINKKGKTPDKYPRKAGKPQKKPL